ncbi:MAG: hypothetical protein IT190_07780, partial [Microbacteriaceae bacterium]|nr:hypothetical protein [Microbacteriaceae bacterium]
MHLAGQGIAAGHENQEQAKQGVEDPEQCFFHGALLFNRGWSEGLHLAIGSPSQQGKSPVSYSPVLTVMINAVRKAARGVQRDYGEVSNLQVSQKGPGDFVTASDKKAESLLRAELSKARPTYGFLGEEEGGTKGQDPDHRFIIDPIDGTSNFMHALPYFALTIALERKGEIVAGVTYNPISDELFHSEKGQGAF